MAPSKKSLWMVQDGGMRSSVKALVVEHLGSIGTRLKIQKFGIEQILFTGIPLETLAFILC